MGLPNRRRIPPAAYEKVWGSTQTEPWFPNPDRKIGEYWFAEAGSPLLIKFLFTTDYLSVQVHPNDRQAAELEPGCRGKTEMWHILRTERDAKLAIGLKADVSAEEVRAGCEDGSVMEMLRWVPASPGDTWYIPAGTIHAIGAGITLVEVQQNSDVTYRLYDYGRPRELHLEKGLRVSDLLSRPEPAGNRVDCPYFSAAIGQIDGSGFVGPGFLIVSSGQGDIEGEKIHQGEVWSLGQRLKGGGRCGIVEVRGVGVNGTHYHQPGK
jgi:mannose-6-phosphate isomerase